MSMAPSTALDGTVQEQPDGEAGEADQGEDGAVDGETPTPALPAYDKKAMEDIAPVERLKQNQAIAKRELEEKQRLIEEMIAAEREKDPDALDEDILSKVQTDLAKKRMRDDTGDTMTNTTQ